MLITTTLEPFASQFRDELRRLGYDDGTTINIEFRMADGNPKILAGRLGAAKGRARGAAFVVPEGVLAGNTRPGILRKRRQSFRQ